MAGQNVIYRLESWSYHNYRDSKNPGKPTCFETKFYQDKQKALARIGSRGVLASSPPPYNPNSGFQRWYQLTEFVASGPVDYYV